MTQEQYDRLPLYARREIDRLRVDVRHYQERLSAGPEDSVAFAEPYSAAPMPLGRNPIIDFHLNTGKVRVQVEQGGAYLSVSSDSGALGVQPQASNVAKVRADGWW